MSFIFIIFATYLTRDNRYVVDVFRFVNKCNSVSYGKLPKKSLTNKNSNELWD